MLSAVISSVGYSGGKVKEVVPYRASAMVLGTTVSGGGLRMKSSSGFCWYIGTRDDGNGPVIVGLGEPEEVSGTGRTACPGPTGAV